MNTIETIDPNVFKHLIVTIGALPTAFIDSMSYYEMIAWLVNYIQNTVVPAINSNAEAVEEIQKWIETLDLQDEVDTKIEEMAENGELATIIAQIVNLGAVFGYENISALASAENLSDGSIARVLGNSNKYDGDGAFYYIRTVIDTDVIDGVNKVNLANTDNLIAVRIENKAFNEIMTTLTTTNTKFAQNILTNTSQTVVFAGDSLTWGEDPTTHTQNTNNFPALVQTWVNDWFENNSLITCINCGAQAGRSADANTNFDTYLGYNPSTIFWQYGTNDVNHNVTITQTIEHLDTFYKKCNANGIELIVIISPQNYQNFLRQKGMRLLHDALITYCESRGIAYVDMFNYIYNLYNSLTTNHATLQSDGTHFVNYISFRDAIVTKLLPVAYMQENAPFSYISVGNNLDYSKSNIPVVIPDGYIDVFKDARIVQTDEDNTFEMNFYTNKRSFLYLNGYTNSVAGTAVFTLDGNDYTIVETGTSASTSATANRAKYVIGTELGAGMHRLKLKSITFTGSQNRFYIFGFTIEEATQAYGAMGLNQFKETCLAWSGNSSSLSDVLSDVTLTDFNRITLEIGGASDLMTVDLRAVESFRNFYENNTWKFPTVYNATNGIASFTINTTNNTISYSTTEDAPLRRVYLSHDNSWYEKPMKYTA